MSKAQGLVSLSASLCSSGYLLPQLLGSFRARFPGIRFQIDNYRDTPHGRFATFRQLEEGRTNLCLCPAERERAPSTDWWPVITDELLLVVPPGHRLAGLTCVRLCEVAGEPFICPRAETSLRDLTDALCRRAQFVPDSRFEVEDLSLICDLVAAGCGVALVPARLEGKCSEQGTSLLQPSGESTQWKVGIAWDKQQTLPLAARLFRQFLVDGAGVDQAG